MYLSVGHHHKADPTGLQSRVKNDLRLNEMSIQFLTQYLCEMSVLASL